MEKVGSTDQILEFIVEVRERRRGFITNFYLDKFKHNIWIKNGIFFFEWIGDTLFLIKRANTFCNIFYVSTNLDSLSASISILYAQHAEITMAFDIIGRNEQCFSLIRMFQEHGFHEACSLVRMNRITETTDSFVDSNVCKATENDITSIYKYLHLYFDEKTEQIPFLEEIEEYAKQGHILICYEDVRVAGFLIYEVNASTLYLRYWFTHPEYRDRKVGSRLLHRFFEEGKNTKRQLLWVIQSNDNAIKRYCHYGFKEENMFDYIMINN